MIVNRRDLATAMGVATTTVDQWLREGCPVKVRGRKGVPAQFELPEVLAWWSARERDKAAGEAPDDKEKLALRKAVAETGKAELDFAKARGEVAPVREFERAQAKIMAAIRSNVLNVAARAVLQLLGETDEATFKRILRAELVLALEQSADAELDLNEDDDAEPDDGAE